MTAQEYEKLKEKLADVQRQKARAEGTIEGIEAQWREDGIDSIDAAEALLATYAERLNALDSRCATLEKRVSEYAHILDTL